MAYQRAVVNCRRCYELAEILSYHMREENARTGILYNGELWTSRNEAMRALEQDYQGNVNITLPGEIRTQEITSQNGRIVQALEECMNCDFGRARIADIFQPTDNEESS